MNAHDFKTILEIVLPVFLIVGIGGVLRKVGWLTTEADQSLMRVIINVLYPCLIFESVFDNQALRQGTTLWAAPLLGAASLGVGYALALLAARWLNLPRTFQRRSFAFATGLCNYGYVAIPITQVLFGKETLGALFVFNVGLELVLFTLMTTIGEHSVAHDWRKLINGPLVALVLGVALNLSGQTAWIPHFAHVTMSMLGACSVPLGILLAGAIGIDLLLRERWTPQPAVMASGFLVRQILLPVLFLLAAWKLPVAQELKEVLVVHAAMPAGIFTIVFIKRYQGDVRVGFSVILFSLVLGLLTVPLWLRAGIAVLAWR
ncbi:MAG: AEC family transporter [bacterium]